MMTYTGFFINADMRQVNGSYINVKGIGISRWF